MPDAADFSSFQSDQVIAKPNSSGVPKPEIVALAQSGQPGSTIPATARSKRFCLILVKPSLYDDDGYVIQWVRSTIPSNSLAAVFGLARDCA